MFESTATLAYREGTVERLAAERALDAVLADSFPASDPPSWTLGVTHVPRETDAAGETDAAASRDGRLDRA